MRKTTLFLALLFTTSLLINCSDSSNDTATASSLVNFNFTHRWESQVIDNTSLNNTTVTNANGEVMNFTRLRYLISRIELVNTNGAVISFDGYKFTDLADTNTYNFSADRLVTSGEYTLRFVWGFNEEDNVDGAYADLNSASWNWPQMLGGGYHFLQFDGNYNVNTTAPSPYNFHNGTARVSTNPNTFEQNFATIEITTPITITRNSDIEIVMDMAEFFRNPNTWDLNVLDTPLMPNYNAQKMMQANVSSVFSLGDVTFF